MVAENLQQLLTHLDKGSFKQVQTPLKDQFCCYVRACVEEDLDKDAREENGGANLNARRKL
jgi:hypothetical protein